MSKLKHILNDLSQMNLKSNEKFSEYINKFKDRSKKVSTRGLTKIEIEKCKIELATKYYRLGQYISKKYHTAEILDFSYDEEYKAMNEKINKLKLYIKNLTNSKNL